MQIHKLLHLYNGYFEQNVWLMLRVLHNLDTNRRNCDKIGFNNKNGSCHAKTKLAVLPLILARVIFNSISNVVSDVVVFVYNGMWLILQNSFHNQLDVSKKPWIICVMVDSSLALINYHANFQGHNLSANKLVVLV